MFQCIPDPTSDTKWIENGTYFQQVSASCMFGSVRLNMIYLYQIQAAWTIDTRCQLRTTGITM